MTPPRPPEGKCELNRCNGNCSSGLRCLVCRNKQAHCSCYKFQPEGKHSPCGCTVDYDVSWGNAEPQRGNFRIVYCPLHASVSKLVAALEMITERYFDDIGRIDLKEIEALLREAAK